MQTCSIFLTTPAYSLDTNQIINFDIKKIVHWLRANKISLNNSKAEIIFNSKKKKITKNLNFWVSEQKIITKTHSRYLGVILDESLSFHAHLNIIKYKLNRTNGILMKPWPFVTSKLLKVIYSSFVDSHMRCACQVWRQSKSRLLTQIGKIQNKAPRLLNFKHGIK